MGLDAAINTAVEEQKAASVPVVPADSQEEAAEANHEHEAKKICAMVRKFVQAHMLRYAHRY